MVVSNPFTGATDPTTGLPLVNPALGYDQIPLGIQPFPYSDYKLVQTPPRGTAFPDDIFPVGANVHGQHPTTGNMQTVNTDGKHALLVSNVAASASGGDLPYTAPNTQGGGLTSVAGTTRQASGGPPGAATTILGFQGSLCFLSTDVAGAGTGEVSIQLSRAGGGNSITIWTWAVSFAGAGPTTGLVFQSFEIRYPLGFPLTAVNGSGNVTVYVNNQTIWTSRVAIYTFWQ